MTKAKNLSLREASKDIWKGEGVKGRGKDNPGDLRTQALKPCSETNLGIKLKGWNMFWVVFFSSSRCFQF